MDQTTLVIVTAILSAVTSSGVMSLVVFLIGRHDKKKEAKAMKNSGESQMLLGLGHDKLIYLTDRFVRRGAISLKEKRNLKFLYEPYARLGGNGDCKIGYEACEKLPVVSEEDARDLDNLEKRREFGLEDDKQSI